MTPFTQKILSGLLEIGLWVISQDPTPAQQGSEVLAQAEQLREKLKNSSATLSNVVKQAEGEG